MGIYHAYQILGFKTFHLIEIFKSNSNLQREVLYEVMEAEKGRAPEYGVDDFDKWWGEYEVIVEIPSMCSSQVISAYLADPDVKFLLVERDPDAWVSSFDIFCSRQWRRIISFPFSTLAYFSSSIRGWQSLASRLYELFAGHRPTLSQLGTPELKADLRRGYIEYIDRVKRLVPSERLCVLRLEDGLGWEQVCGFLEVPVPNTPYPGRRGHDEVTQPFFRRATIDTVRKMGTFLVPAIGMAVWLAINRQRYFRV